MSEVPSSPDASSTDAEPHPGADEPRGVARLLEVARLFFKLGLIAFGGPAAHIAMMEDEFVTRRKWITRQHFLDLIGATNLIPGPNSTEMTMHVGYERAGWPGLFTAGACFIFPAVVITGGLAWLYVEYGEVPQVEPFLYGIKPAVIAVILGAVWKLGRSAVKGWRLGVIGFVAAALVLQGVGEIQALLACGIVGMLWIRYSGTADTSTAERFIPILFMQQSAAQHSAPAADTSRAGPSLADSAAVAAGAAGAAAGVSLWKLGFFFLKVGSILYGSGYVLVAFLQGDLVDSYGWLTQQELLDAIAIGQFTPGPVLSTSTFIGYVIEGIPGAIVATLGIFLPSFLFVWILNPLVPKLRDSVWTAAFLDAVNVAAVGLMVAVTVELGFGVLDAWPAFVITGVAAVAALVFRLNAAWIVVGGAVLGWLLG